MNVDRTTERTPVIAAVVLTAVCTCWVVVALIHPTSFTDETRPLWVVVHIAQLVFAMGVLALLKGAQGPTAAPARGTAVLWAAWFSAYDAVAGIATGILAGGGAREAGEYLYAHDLIAGLGWVAVGMWLLTAISAGLVLRDSKPLVTPVALFISALVFTHAGPPGRGIRCPCCSNVDRVDGGRPFWAREIKDELEETVLVSFWWSRWLR